MIRITGGQFRGREITCPKGQAVRPSTSFMRESLFNILGSRIIEARFLDLFAGCGIVGLEALSRGAGSVMAVESKPQHCKILEKNRQLLNLELFKYQISCHDAFAWVQKQSFQTEPFDIIFLDPPYALENIESIIETCFKRNVLSPDGILVWENNRKTLPPISSAVLSETRRYGSSNLSFFKYPESSELQTG